jgi:hypothetical protein
MAGGTCQALLRLGTGLQQGWPRGLSALTLVGDDLRWTSFWSLKFDKTGRRYACWATWCFDLLNQCEY